MLDALQGFLRSDFMPHGHCYLWRPDLLLLQASSDSLIALAYFLIPFALLYFVRRRTDLAFKKIFWLFGAFILLCGMTHVLEVWSIWHGTYYLTGSVKLVTGLVSITTAMVLVPLVPKALALPSPDDLCAANAALQAEIAERRQAEAAVRKLNAELEDRVHARTAELEAKNEALEHEIAARKEIEAELKKAKLQAEEMARMKSAFLANMSHEIRTPLTSIIGFASLLSAEVKGKYRPYAALIEQGGQRLLDTINAVLTLAKLEAGGVQITLDALAPVQDIEEILPLFHPMAEKKNLALHLDVEPEAESAQAALDRGALSSILYNLIGNAIKYTDEGSVTVRLRVESDADQLAVDVIDTGRGIEPDFIPHLFDSFRQASEGIQRTHEGSGLGLSITRRLVELMQGTISVQSEPGEGSTFTVVFPLLDAEVPERGDHTTTAAPPHVSPGHAAPMLETPASVLLVEDHAETALLVTHSLQETAHVTVAPNVAEALQLADEQPFDFVLADINLSEPRSGLDLLHLLREHPRYRDIPIVALTAYALPGDREYFLDQGFTEYMSKPFNTKALHDLVHALLLKQQS